MDFSCLLIPLLFFPPVSYSAVPLQSIDVPVFSSINSFSSRRFRSSPSIVSALLVARSASVRRLFILFLSINRFSSHQFRSSPSITSAILSLMDLGGVRQKMARQNCERINAVKAVNGYIFKNVGTQ